MIFIPSNALIRSGGYNEKLKDYGYDDTSLYEKLIKDGYTRKDINQDCAQHIPHSAKIRSGEGDPVIFIFQIVLKKNQDLRLNIMTNMFLCEFYPWDETIPKVFLIKTRFF